MDSPDAPSPPLTALGYFGMNSPDARRLVDFYEQAFGVRVNSRQRLHKRRFSHWPGIKGGAERIEFSLGEATVELLEFDHPGRHYPPDLSPYDTRFQHLGIVVTDLQAAVERLSPLRGWTAISIGGPQQLPDNDGRVSAFKFRDPDGHPLEVLQFDAAHTPAHWRGATGGSLYRGIDHSALSVSDADRSVRFYESLGLRVAQRTRNQGPAQQRLDGVPDPVVDVISLTPPQPTPHVELLHYHSQTRPAHDAPACKHQPVRLTASSRIPMVIS
jgi:catechol 2,3-dioxygenase-like lactoylglutathione lyase family enzyme